MLPKNERKTSALVATAKCCKYFVHSLDELKQRKIASEINWPENIACADSFT